MKRIRMILGPLALAVGLAACSGGSGGSSPAVASPRSGPQIVAKDMKFQQTNVELPANKVDSVAFVNQDGAPHNVAIFTDSSASKPLRRRRDFEQHGHVSDPGPSARHLFLPLRRAPRNDWIDHREVGARFSVTGGRLPGGAPLRRRA